MIVCIFLILRFKNMKGKIHSKSLSRYLAVQAIFNQSFGFDQKQIEKEFVTQNDLNFTLIQILILIKKFDKVFLKKFLIMFLKRKILFVV